MNDDDRTQLDVIEEKVTLILNTITEAKAIIDKVAAEVMPTLNELLKSPMLKMLGVGKK